MNEKESIGLLVEHPCFEALVLLNYINLLKLEHNFAGIFSKPRFTRHIFICTYVLIDIFTTCSIFAFHLLFEYSFLLFYFCKFSLFPSSKKANEKQEWVNKKKINFTTQRKCTADLFARATCGVQYAACNCTPFSRVPCHPAKCTRMRQMHLERNNTYQHTNTHTHTKFYSLFEQIRTWLTNETKRMERVKCSGIMHYRMLQTMK